MFMKHNPIDHLAKFLTLKYKGISNNCQRALTYLWAPLTVARDKGQGLVRIVASHSLSARISVTCLLFLIRLVAQYGIVDSGMCYLSDILGIVCMWVFYLRKRRSFTFIQIVIWFSPTTLVAQQLIRDRERRGEEVCQSSGVTPFFCYSQEQRGGE